MLAKLALRKTERILSTKATGASLGDTPKQSKSEQKGKE